MTLALTHRFVPAPPEGDRQTLLLLHGTGGNEDSLLDLGRRLAPGAALLSPRGAVLEHGMPRFFRRVAEAVFDLEDLAHRSDELASFIAAAAREYRFDPARVTAEGFSNGANIAASLLLRHGPVLSRAVLWRAMVPFEPDRLPALDGVSVWLGAGRLDPLVRPENTERLSRLLQSAGATVVLDWRDAGHQLLPAEVDAVQAWLASEEHRLT